MNYGILQKYSPSIHHDAESCLGSILKRKGHIRYIISLKIVYR